MLVQSYVTRKVARTVKGEAETIEYVVMIDRVAHDPMCHDSRARLAESCGTRESPSFNLGRGQREQSEHVAKAQ